MEIGQLYFICRSQKIIDLPEFEMLKKCVMCETHLLIGRHYRMAS